VRYIVIAAAFATLAILAASPKAEGHELSKGKRDTEAYWRHNYYHAFYTLRWWEAIFGKRQFISMEEVALEQREVRKHRRLLRISQTKLRKFNIDSCLRELIRRESGAWPPYSVREAQVTNPYSGAYGLGQALPASKMAPYGSDYMTNPYTQIRWMKSYVRRYGGSCSALAYQRANGYY